MIEWICVCIGLVVISLYCGYVWAVWRLYKTLEETWDLHDKIHFRYVVFHTQEIMSTVRKLFTAAASMEDDLK